jgi:hypothetical protein
MRGRLTIPVLVLACLGLLSGQLTGLHMHVNEHGYSGIPVGLHVHRTQSLSEGAPPMTHIDRTDHNHHPGDRHHDGDRDVSAIELVAGVSKLFIPLAWVALGFVIVLGLESRISLPAFVFLPRARPERWRPPLRAPPGCSHR